MQSNKYLWIIGGGEMQIPTIIEAKKLNLATIISDLNPECPCKELCDIFINIDIFDIENHIKQAENLISNGIKIAGVLAAGIDAPETMAKLNEFLGLRGVKSEIARLVHNKADFRKKLSELGFPVPKFQKITLENINQIEELSDQIGYPLIIKNTDSSGSRGTKIFHKKNLNELIEIAKLAISVSKSKTALIESFWSGPEQTVETIFDVDGTFHPCFITDRQFDKSQRYALETGLIHPSQLPTKTQNEMFETAENVARALGIDVGAAKYDFILTPDGPRIIEMTVRLSGGFDCQYLVPAATGKNILQAAILTAMGEKFDPEILKNKFNKVAISRSIWPRSGKITNIKGVEQAKNISGVEKIIMRSKIGDYIEDYTDCTKRTSFIIISAASLEIAEKIFQEVQNTIAITVN